MTLITIRQDAVKALVEALVDRRAPDGVAVAEIVERHPAQVEKVLAMTGIIVYGYPLGEWRPLMDACRDEPPEAVVILGDCGLEVPPPG